MPTDAPTPNRRRFLVATGAALGFVPLATALAGCGGGGDVTAASCPGYSALTPEQQAARTALEYVDVTPVPGQRCDNCRFYNVPTGATSPCGGCQLFRGPVAPAGHCRSWAAKA